VFVLLTAYALPNKLTNLVFYIQELIMSFNKFYSLCNA